MSKIDMSYLNKLTVPEKLELLSLASYLKSSDATNKEKVATLLSIVIDSEEMAKLISNKFAGEEYGKKDFFDKLINDTEFYNAFETPSATSFLSEIQDGVNQFLENLDIEKDLNFEYLTADENQVSIINPFKGINGESGNTENFKYYFDSDVKVEEFNKSILPKVLKGFNTAVAYDGTNKKGRILYRSDKARSLDFKQSTRKFALIKNLYYLVARKEKDALETRNIFVNNIRNRKLQVKRVKKAIGNVAVNSKLTADDQDKRRYKMESSVERIGNFIYDSVLSTLIKNKKFTKATIKHFNTIYSKEYSFEEYQNIKLLAGLLATKYIIQYVDFDKYASKGTDQALQSKLDNTIGKVSQEVGYDEKMFVPAHIIAKKICKDFFKLNKESFAKIAIVYTKKEVDNNIISLDDAMFRTVYDPNDIGIYLQQKNIENNFVNEPFSAEEQLEEQENGDEAILEDGEELNNQENTVIDVEESNEAVEVEDSEQIENEEKNALCTPLFSRLYVINSKEKILARLKELEANKEVSENQDNKEEKEEKTYLSFISEADLIKTFGDESKPSNNNYANLESDSTKLLSTGESAILIPERAVSLEHTSNVSLAGGAGQDSGDIVGDNFKGNNANQVHIADLTKFSCENFSKNEANVNVEDVKELLYDLIGDLSNRIIIELGYLAEQVDNKITEEQAAKDMNKILKSAYGAFKQSIKEGKEVIQKLNDDKNPYFGLYDYAYDYIHAIDMKYGLKSDYNGKISEALKKEILDRFEDNINQKFEKITTQAGHNCLLRNAGNRGRIIRLTLLNIIRDKMNEIYLDLGKLSPEERSKINATMYKNTRDALLFVGDATNKLIDNHEDLRTIKGGASYDVQLLDCAKSIKNEIANHINNNTKLNVNEEIIKGIYAENIKGRITSYIKNHLLSVQNLDFSPSSK